MPYIPQEQRTQEAPETAGQLNYQITGLVDRFITDNEGVNYTNLNTAIGVLECAKLELYRRLAGPYEDQKLQENGEVYGQ